MDDSQEQEHAHCRRPEKDAYPTRRVAKRIARRLAGKGRALSAYRCDCGYYHLGHSTADERARIRETR